MRSPLSTFLARVAWLTGSLVWMVSLVFSAAATKVFQLAEPYPEILKPSMAVVEGNPAVVWTGMNGNASRLHYARALDADGTAWSPPVIIDGTGEVPAEPLLFVVGGKPAIAFSTSGSPAEQLKFIRANDTTGTSWSNPVVLVDGGLALRLSAEIVNGHPAIAFSSTVPNLYYVRALDPAGSAWSPAVTAGAVGRYTFSCSLKMVQGRPAVAFGDFSDTWFARANDESGSSWGQPVNVRMGTKVDCVSLCVVNGLPAVSINGGFGDTLRYAQAATVTGSAWKPDIMLDFRAGGRFCALRVQDGKPEVAYAVDGFDLDCITAQDADGAAWGPARRIFHGSDTRLEGTLQEMNGRPAIVYYSPSRGTIEYLRAVPSVTGPTHWPPFISVSQNGTVIPDGGTVDWGSVAVGGAALRIFKLENLNTASTGLTIESLTIDGTDAAEFAVTVPPLTPLAPPGETSFTVRHAPLTAGIKSARLRIVSNAAGSPCEILLAGHSLPDIAVEQPDGNSLSDGTTRVFPFTPPDTVADIRFLLRNPGGAALTGLSFTFNGPDAGEFSLPDAPSQVPPGGFIPLTVRHTTHTGGAKNVTLHIASNVSGPRYPFEITIRMLPGTTETAFPVVPGIFPALALQGDGKILAGDLTRLLRLNADGSPDLLFFPPAFSNSINCLAAQKDGRILVGGLFSTVNGQPRAGIARLLPDGSLDPSFTPSLRPGVYCIAIQPDGKILAGGYFSLSGTGPQKNLVRLHANGSLDSAFSPQPDSNVSDIFPLTGGKVLIGGGFNTIGAVAAPHLARLTATGAVDVFSGSTAGVVFSLAVQPDGKILAGGQHPSLLSRFHPNGLLDLAPDVLPAGQGLLQCLSLAADGSCLGVGGLSAAGETGRYRFTRIRSDGSRDDSFDPPLNGRVYALAVQPDGRVIVGGSYTMIGSVSRSGLTRLDNDAAFTVLLNEGSSTLRWLRGGTAPEVRDVTFDVKPAGSPGWMPLGAAARIPGGWELAGLSLPSSGSIRAQGYAGGSVMESTSAILTSLESWRMAYFHISTATGDAADDADPDKDGLTNFIEFAFGSSPVDGRSLALPEFKRDGPVLSAAFTAPQGRDGVIYGAEWSATMLPDTWTAIPDTGTAPVHTFQVQATGNRMFVRFVVKQ